ncbi:L-aspartate oxidase [Microlunatus parietis]|uniref:L-aspartate oxidase n=1 Tax=Microlunatus parietis TaxID=682979 RepID=A0A7Y9IAY7_9ACTN|nr:L-aspartate oxidase [Microlunatus parietis]NYE73505.1 L-aspartate oxidase [Microlunatus parietis]
MTDLRLPTRLPVGPVARRTETDVIIVGSGAAGLAAAIRLLEAGRRVTMITKGTLGDGSTAWAQGGLAAVTDPADSLTDHLADTLAAGAGLCEPNQVAALVAAAPAAIERLIELGARFDRAVDGALALGLEGGHHRRRIVHAGGDASGAEVARSLAAALTGSRPARPGRHGSGARFTPLEHCTAIDAIGTADGVVRGLRVIDSDGVVGEWFADAVVLAAGGIGQAWSTTTNPATATGDGLGIALRAGAVIRDPEFVQFHPTVLVVPPEHRRPGDRGVLISEAVRGEGARLVNGRGELIMDGRHPMGDLAPRDIVAAAMHADLLATGDDHLFLDGTALGATTWRQHFPTILQLCRERGVDPITEPIPVRPAEHYFCGGVLATLDGLTTVPGLYAVGEVASTGVHGANRLASNSLTEAFVAGDRLGRLLAVRDAETEARFAVISAALRYGADLDDFDHPFALADRAPAVISSAQRPRLVEAISRGAGVFREESGLTGLLAELAALPRSDQAGSVADVETTNLQVVGALVGTAALLRTESRGSHRRSDHDRPVTAWQRHSYLALQPDGRLRTATETAAAAA